MGALDLSDSDEDALFDTPAARKTTKPPREADASTDDGAAGTKTRTKESHYTTEEAREVQLRRELESIRNVNKVIEGVVESLQKAKDNMAVGGCRPLSRDTPNNCTDGVSHSAECFDVAADMDAHTFPDRAQSAAHSKSAVAGCVSGPG